MAEHGLPIADPVYEALLKPLFTAAEEALYLIGRAIKGR